VARDAEMARAFFERAFADLTWRVEGMVKTPIAS
jgi:hypothetical protein